MKRQREYKETRGVITNVDEDLGEITAIFSVFGNVDLGNDRIWPGTFTKTFAERGNDILALDQHRTQSTTDTIAKPVAFREVPKEELPEELLRRYPEATGGAEATLKFEPDRSKDQKSAEVFYRLKNGWINQWSFGYDALDYDYTEEVLDGKKANVRNLRTIRLYEVSPVLWGMNPATVTTGAKGMEGKPWNVFPEDGEYCVYKIDEDGNPVGEPIGECHATEEEARNQVEALYANVEEEMGKPNKDDKILKSYNLSEHIRDVISAFYAQYPDEPELGLWYWVNSVYDDHVIIEKGLEDGRQCFSINYTLDPDSNVVFSQEWVEGKYVFVPLNATEEEYGQMATTILQEGKAGRVLSQRNADKIVGALTTLLDVLGDAGIDIPLYDDDGEEVGKAVSTYNFENVDNTGVLGKLDEVISYIRQLTAPQEEAADIEEEETCTPKAGPDVPPTSILDVESALIEIETLL